MHALYPDSRSVAFEDGDTVGSAVVFANIALFTSSPSCVPFKAGSMVLTPGGESVGAKVVVFPESSVALLSAGALGAKVGANVVALTNKLSGVGDAVVSFPSRVLFMYIIVGAVVATGAKVGAVVLAIVGAPVISFSSDGVGLSVPGGSVVGASVAATTGEAVGELVSIESLEGDGARVGSEVARMGAVLGLLSSPPDTANTRTMIPAANRNKHRIVMETQRLRFPVSLLVIARCPSALGRSPTP